MHPATRWTQFITPLGGIIALTCFFMPWVGMSAPLIRRNNSLTFNRLGVNLFLTEHPVPNAFFITAAFIASVAIVGLSIYMVIRRKPWACKVPTLISSGIGLSNLLSVYLMYVKIYQNSDIGDYSGKFGFWGTVAGFVIAVIGTLLIRSDEENNDSKVSVQKKQFWFVVHAGGIVALFCFFMPWEGIGALMGHSGFELMNREFVVRIAFLTSIITLAGSFYTLASGNFRRLRVVVLVSIGIGLGILLTYCFNFYVEGFVQQRILRSVGAEVSKESFKFGLWGTILGYIVSAVGMFLINGKNKNKQVEVPAE